MFTGRLFQTAKKMKTFQNFSGEEWINKMPSEFIHSMVCDSIIKGQDVKTDAKYGRNLHTLLFGMNRTGHKMFLTE